MIRPLAILSALTLTGELLRAIAVLDSQFDHLSRRLSKLED